jgi:hypothetical protein
MNTVQKRPDVLYPERTKEARERSAVDAIIALMVVAVLAGILYCFSYFQSPLPGTLTSHDTAKLGASAWKATASESRNLPLPMPLPFPMPIQDSAPLVDRGVGDSIHVGASPPGHLGVTTFNQ